MNNQNQSDDNLVLPQPQANNFMLPNDNTPDSNIGNQSVDTIKSSVVNSSSDGMALNADVDNDVTTKVNQTSAVIDSDLIEKEWVNKIKAIIESTRGNPFLQSKEINDLKTEYVYAKYNKVIKAE